MKQKLWVKILSLVLVGLMALSGATVAIALLVNLF